MYSFCSYYALVTWISFIGCRAFTHLIWNDVYTTQLFSATSFIVCVTFSFLFLIFDSIWVHFGHVLKFIGFYCDIFVIARVVRCYFFEDSWLSLILNLNDPIMFFLPSSFFWHLPMRQKVLVSLLIVRSNLRPARCQWFLAN